MYYIRKSKLFLFLAAVAIIFLLSCQPDRKNEKTEPISITLAASTYIGSAPIFVAKEKGFFLDQGLAVTLIVNDAGVESLTDLKESRAHMAMVAELPIVYSYFDKYKYTDEKWEDLVIIADMVLSNNISRILTRRDRGIEKPEDLRGKTIAVPKGTSIDYLLDLFLLTHGIERSEIIIIDKDVRSQVEAIVYGDVDAIFSWQPHIAQAIELLDSEAYLMPLNLFYHNAWLAVTLREFALANAQVLESFLKALLQAEQFMSRYPAQAISIHAQYSNLSPDVIAHSWKDILFEVNLGEALLTTMEDEARWVMGRHESARLNLPDFLSLIHFEPMLKVKPHGVTIIQ